MQDDRTYRIQDSAVIVPVTDPGYQQLFEELSHALQNPLTYLATTLSLCRDRVLDEDTFAELEQSVARISDTARSMLSYARSAYAPATEHVCLSSLVERVCALMRGIARSHDVGLLVSVTPAVYVNGDARSLSELIENLLANAIRYTSGCEVRQVHTELSYENDSVLLSIRDTGIGIPEDEIPNVKERLYRASNAQARPGTGFGLAIAERIARQHGAVLEIASELGHGTAVQVRFPATYESGMLTNPSSVTTT